MPYCRTGACRSNVYQKVIKVEYNITFNTIKTECYAINRSPFIVVGKVVIQFMDLRTVRFVDRAIAL